MRPLVLLDVDGVINDLGAARGVPRPWTWEVVRSHGYDLYVPDYMPALVRHLARRAEVWWCTTWRDRANDELAAHLGVGPFPVVDDGTTSSFVEWKPAAARPLVTAAFETGRRVYWIEDFYGMPPVDELPAGVVYVDTAPTLHTEAVLRPEHLPRVLRPGEGR